MLQMSERDIICSYGAYIEERDKKQIYNMSLGIDKY